MPNHPPCSNHRRDNLGWPLGDCSVCVAYRKQMDNWYMAEVLASNPNPDGSNLPQDR